MFRRQATTQRIRSNRSGRESRPSQTDTAEFSAGLQRASQSSFEPPLSRPVACRSNNALLHPPRKQPRFKPRVVTIPACFLASSRWRKRWSRSCWPTTGYAGRRNADRCLTQDVCHWLGQCLQETVERWSVSTGRACGTQSLVSLKIRFETAKAQLNSVLPDKLA
jgi:hypothetical protein